MFSGCQDHEELQRVAEIQLVGLFSGLRHRIFLESEEFKRFLADPVAARLMRDHSATHEALVVDNATWRRYCPRADHGHVLVGPLVAGGRVLGAVAVTRAEPPFDEGELRRMNAFCLFLSSRWSELAPPLPGLTPRETEVARAVREGLRNAEVAARLGVSEHTVKQNLKAIFRKLGVRSRTELLARGGPPRS